jgi:iron(III) transport system substrate-binding protein
MRALAGAFCLAVGLFAPARAQPPEYVSRAALVAFAEREGALQVLSTTDTAEVSDLLADFRTLYPGIKLEYGKRSSGDLYGALVRDAAAGTGSADLLWSSAMDLQIKLVNDGYAQAYASPEAAGLPDWAVWRDEAYGVTAEPVVIVHNRRLVPETDVPRTHADLLKLLVTKPEAYQGKVATYDPERSGTGFLFLTQDAQITKSTWDLARAMGQVGVKLYGSSDAMLDRISSGEALIAYNVIGSYALARAKHDPAIGVVFPADYAVVMTRIAVIPKAARHPNAARLFLDHLLSRRGQELLAAQFLSPVRRDLAGSAEALIPASLEPALRPIHVGPALLTYLDQAKRARFLKEWQRALQGR